MKKIKLLLQDDRVFYSVLLIVITITAFLLGRQSVLHDGVQPVSDRSQTAGVQMLQDAPAPVVNEVQATTVVASKNGTRYYYPDCAGVSRIRKENLVSFSSVEQAQAAGYSLATNCSL